MLAEGIRSRVVSMPSLEIADALEGKFWR